MRTISHLSNRRKCWHEWIFLALFLILPICSAEGRGQTRIHDAVREFEARDITGRTWTLDDVLGNVVLLDFWATWCAPCLQEIPYLRRAYDRFRDEGLVILGISLDTRSARDFRSWLKWQGVVWPQVLSRLGYEDPVVQSFGVKSIPVSILIDRKGTVAGVNLRGRELVERISVLIHEAPANSALRGD